MRLVMIDADERFAQRERDGLRGLEPDQQRDRQSRPLRGGHGVKLRRRKSPASLKAALATGRRFFRCSRAASSGTTPPYSACSLICDETVLDRIFPSRTTAALVSSQEVSMARMVMGCTVES